MPEIAGFASILTNALSPQLASAVTQSAMPGLADGPRNDALATILSSGDLQTHLAGAGDRVDEIISGLWLLAGDLDRSHTISQDLPSAEGSFLHGIMHRREGDFGNAKYWFRRVGDHPVFDQIAQAAGSVYDDPSDFVDLCSDAIRRGEPDDCMAAQWIEWQCIMAYLC
ncbi:hypothetical protein [Planctomycetes bacterium K23_9]|uniref:Uncharacterized protein n=1 Tax=Stieleria marina TaxID=1930275 RepID=A0A517NVS1_9BACT|nr:hypothetical protein K239x_32190 [Planctomycetes bacterium K23_9]